MFPLVTISVENKDEQVFPLQAFLRTTTFTFGRAAEHLLPPRSLSVWRSGSADGGAGAARVAGTPRVAGCTRRPRQLQQQSRRPACCCARISSPAACRGKAKLKVGRAGRAIICGAREAGVSDARHAAVAALLSLSSPAPAQARAPSAAAHGLSREGHSLTNLSRSIATRGEILLLTPLLRRAHCLAVGSVFIEISLFEEQMAASRGVSTAAAPRERRPSFTERLANPFGTSPGHRSPGGGGSASGSASGLVSDDAPAAASSSKDRWLGGGFSFTKRKTADGAGAEPNPRNSVRNSVRGGGFARRASVFPVGLASAVWKMPAAILGGRRSTARSDDAEDENAPPPAAPVRVALSPAEEAKWNAARIARQVEARVALEIQLQNKWRINFKDAPGLEAEMAKMHATITAKQISDEWEAEQAQIKSQQAAHRAAERRARVEAERNKRERQREAERERERLRAGGAKLSVLDAAMNKAEPPAPSNREYDRPGGNTQRSVGHPLERGHSASIGHPLERGHSASVSAPGLSGVVENTDSPPPSTENPLSA
jgi:hypothetical protein